MTTSNLDIISRGLRDIGVIASGDVPTGAELSDALETLQDVVLGLPLLMDGEWCDVILSSAADYSASDGERINATAYPAAAITLPTTYTDRCTNQEVPQKDLSRVQIIGGDQAGVYIYAASVGAWARCDNLAAGGDDEGGNPDSPFGKEDDRRLAALISVAVAEAQYGGKVPDVIAGRAAAAINSFRARLYREVIVRADEAYLWNSYMGWPYEYSRGEGFSRG